MANANAVITVAIPEDLARQAEIKADELKMSLTDYVLFLCRGACDAQPRREHFFGNGRVTPQKKGARQ